ncbi:MULTISPECIES: MFS transporter [unclassified Nocardia]|uniref:MFS transporter n=1 Tax=unclassified Nocardia TaxID=2637762 RepID=UPI00278C6C4F|nr:MULTISPECIES: MFS transporter [unclassified Nocardia]
MRAVLFRGSADLIPLYALYALIFADHGLSTAQISGLLAIWSATAFLLEVPSGAWADTVSRRGLLLVGGVLLVAGFGTWTLFPSYLGFALGFVLWGTAGALQSGTFEALVYDELAARGETADYARIMGYTRAASEAAALLGILAAAPLYAWGGYALVGWASVAIAAVHTVLALTLPAAPRTVTTEAAQELADADEPAPPHPHAGDSGSAPHHRMQSVAGTVADSTAGTAGDSTAGTVAESTAGTAGISDAGKLSAAPGSVLGRYVFMLRAGLGEAVRIRPVRHALFLGALLYGMTAFDEYFALLADDAGVPPWATALLVGLTVTGALLGSTLAGRTEAMRARTMATALAVGGVLFIGGALLPGAAAHRPEAVYPLTIAGFTAIGIAYGIVYNAGVVAAARLQDAIEGPARATVTSVSGLLEEVFSLAVFGFVALASSRLPIPPTVALLGVPILVTALLVPAWLPPRGSDH